MKYQCDHCGECCRHLIVEADELDVLREPRLLSADDRTASLPVQEVMDELREEGMCLVIAGAHECMFHQQDRCQIYPTRPNVCVAMQAGDEQCRMARGAAGLPPLEAVPPEQEGHQDTTEDRGLAR